MRAKIKEYFILLTALAAVLVNCRDQLFFLNDSNDLQKANDFQAFDTKVEHQKKNSNLQTDGLKAIPDYDMYVLAIQWGSKIIRFFIFSLIQKFNYF